MTLFNELKKRFKKNNVPIEQADNTENNNKIEEQQQQPIATTGDSQIFKSDDAFKSYLQYVCISNNNFP